MFSSTTRLQFCHTVDLSLSPEVEKNASVNIAHTVSDTEGAQLYSYCLTLLKHIAIHTILMAVIPVLCF